MISADIADTNDGSIPHAVTSGADLTVTYLLQLGAFYARQWSTYAPEAGMF